MILICNYSHIILGARAHVFPLVFVFFLPPKHSLQFMIGSAYRKNIPFTSVTRDCLRTIVIGWCKPQNKYARAIMPRTRMPNKLWGVGNSPRWPRKVGNRSIASLMPYGTFCNPRNCNWMTVNRTLSNMTLPKRNDKSWICTRTSRNGRS